MADPDGDVVVAVDLGGTTMRGALATGEGRLLEIDERPTPANQGGEAVLEALIGLTEALAERADELDRPCRAAGIAIPGLVDEPAGVSRRAVNLDWADVPVVRRVGERVSLPVALTHDVRAAGRAEARFGAAQDCRDWVFVALGTGIAAAVMVRGETYGGARWQGGEIGHIQIDRDGPPCACGARGHLEAIASAGALSRLYREQTGETLSAEEIARRAADGDPVAGALWRDAVKALASGLATYVALLDPALIVLGGGLAGAGERLLDPLRPELQHRLPFMQAPEVVPSVLGADAGVLGAALRAQDELR